MVTWLVGQRVQESFDVFIKDLSERVAGRIQLTTDAHSSYITAVRAAFKHHIDYAHLVKTFGPDPSGVKGRYSPPICTGCRRMRKIGNPDPEYVSTSIVERSNLTLGTTTRRSTRLTNAYSRKAENHAHAVSLAFMAYNFCTPHATLTKEYGRKMSPAMAAGVTDRLWTMEDIIARMDPDRLLHQTDR